METIQSSLPAPAAGSSGDESATGQPAGKVAAEAGPAAAPADATWPPAGYVEREEAARLLGVVPLTLKRWVDEGKVARANWFDKPGGRRCLLYRVEDLQRAQAQMAAAAAQWKLPEGFVDRQGAARMFGVAVGTWDVWERQGRVPRGEPGRSRTNKPCLIYDVARLEQALREMRSADKVFRQPGKRAIYHVPAGFVRVREACAMFGVEHGTFHRWELEGRITCGVRANASAPKMYPVEALERILAECGRYSPPYPDPDRPGVWRVPLAGWDIQRREAIVDEADLPIVRGKRCHWSERGQGQPGYVGLWDRGEAGALHQAILGVRGTEYCVSHRNGDPLDCRRSNLLVRTRQALVRSRPKVRHYGGWPCSSRFKGVCFDKQTGRWRAGIVIDGKTRCLGRHRDEIAAAEAYDEAARELFGDDARLNFPDGVDAWIERQAA